MAEQTANDSMKVSLGVGHAEKKVGEDKSVQQKVGGRQIRGSL